MRSPQIDPEFRRKNSDLAYPGRWGLFVQNDANAVSAALIAVDAELNALGGRVQLHVAYLYHHIGMDRGEGFFGLPLPDSAKLSPALGAFRRDEISTPLTLRPLEPQSKGPFRAIFREQQDLESMPPSPAWRMVWFQLGTMEPGDAVLLRLSYHLHSLSNHGSHHFVLPFPVEYHYFAGEPYLGLEREVFWRRDHGGCLIIPRQDDTWRQRSDSCTCAVHVRARIHGHGAEQIAVTALRHPLGRGLCDLRLARNPDPWFEYLMDDPLTPDWKIVWNWKRTQGTRARAWKWKQGGDEYMLLQMSSPRRSYDRWRRAATFLFVVDASAIREESQHACIAWEKLDELLEQLDEMDRFAYAFVSGNVEMYRGRPGWHSGHGDSYKRDWFRSSSPCRENRVLPTISKMVEEVCSEGSIEEDVTLILVTGGCIQDLEELRVWLRQHHLRGVHALLVGRPPVPHPLKELLREQCGLTKNYDPVWPGWPGSHPLDELLQCTWVRKFEFPAGWEVLGPPMARLFLGGNMEVLLRRTSTADDARMLIKMKFSSGEVRVCRIHPEPLDPSFFNEPVICPW